MRYLATIERAGGEKPALVADWLLMMVLK
jgi:hypothetical protein